MRFKFNFSGAVMLSGFVVLLMTGFTCTPTAQTNSTEQQLKNVTSQVNESEPSSNTNEIEIAIESPLVNSEEVNPTQFFSTLQLEGVDSHLNFSAHIPSEWDVEYIPEIESINFFDPLAEGENNLDKSQLFTRYFEANQFLTLQTVTIYSQTESTLNGRPAVTYDIEKKTGVANFPFQPSWRNQRHLVTDIRSTDENPTVFYVFGQRPGLDQPTIQAVLESISFEQSPALFFPIQDFTTQSNKKVFGTYITPATSPVQPERFSGYHTGVDVEMTEAQLTQDIPVFAISDGVVSLKQTADGYGGVLAMEFLLDGQTLTAIYGHVRLSSITAEVGDQVTAGEQLGVLGTGFSTETDGERKHLHFALVPGSEATLLGYVSTQAQLDYWVDPLQFFSERETLLP